MVKFMPNQVQTELHFQLLLLQVRFQIKTKINGLLKQQSKQREKKHLNLQIDFLQGTKKRKKENK